MSLGPAQYELMQHHKRFFAAFESCKITDAKLIAEQASSLAESRFGAESAAAIPALNELAMVYEMEGDESRARPLRSRAIALGEKLAGPDHPEIAVVLAQARWREGDGASALKWAEKALSQMPVLPWPFTNVTAGHAKLENLVGAIHLSMGRFDLAEKTWKQALQSLEGTMDEVTLAQVRLNLGGLYTEKADYSRASQLLEQAHAALVRLHGPDHPHVAAALNNLALLSRAMGKLEEAEERQSRAVEVTRLACGAESLPVARLYRNLGQIRHQGGQLAAAEELYRRALRIQRQKLSAAHPELAISMSDIAAVMSKQGKTAGAVEEQRAVLDIQRRGLPPNHPDITVSLNNLATYLLQAGEPGAALVHQREALERWAAQLGHGHPHVATAGQNLAVIQWASGDVPGAVRSAEQAGEARESALATVLSSGSEEQRRKYIRTLGSEPSALVTLALRSGDPGAARLALTTVLRRKGRVLDAMADSFGALRRRMAPTDHALFDELREVRTELATLELRRIRPDGSPATTGDGDSTARYIRDLAARAESLEAKLSERSAAFREQSKPVTIEAVQRTLDAGGALVEWVAYRPYSPMAVERLGVARYAVVVLRAAGDPVWLDLAESAQIDQEVTALHKLLDRNDAVQPIDEVRGRSRAVHHLVFAPIHAALAGARRLYLSPDARLNQVPFAALVDERGRYLLEDYVITYLTSGRDRLRAEQRAPSRSAPVVVGDPDYGPPAGEGHGHQRLSQSGAEAVRVAKIVGAPFVLLRGQASEATLKAVVGPRLLHVATHGDYAERDNALLGTSLILAGANVPTTTSTDDGILTALEVSTMDLVGTRLVVLSACRSGLGQTTIGEGVYGMRRALVLAGAETQVMALWPTDVEATSRLMEDFYGALEEGAGRSVAMRFAQMRILGGKDSHPYYWGSLVVSGDDATLDGRPAAMDFSRVPPSQRGCACDTTADIGELGALEVAIAFVPILSIVARRRRRSRKS